MDNKYLTEISRKLQNLTEKRSHPETNIDPTFEEYLNKILSSAPIEDLFVSFRKEMYVTDINPKTSGIPKVGIKALEQIVGL